MLHQRRQCSVLLSLKSVALPPPPPNPIPNLTEPNQLKRPSNPTENDCYDAVTNYPACANATWIMYEDSHEYFCCEPGQIASTENGYGLCEPAGVAVPPNLLAPTISQDTVAAPSTTIATTETETAVTGTATATATATAGVVSTTTAATGATSTAVSSSAGANATVVMPSLQTSAVGSTMATTSSPAAGSPSGSASASVSAETGSSVGASNGPTVVGAVFALCFGVGVAVLMG